MKNLSTWLIAAALVTIVILIMGLRDYAKRLHQCQSVQFDTTALHTAHVERDSLLVVAGNQQNSIDSLFFNSTDNQHEILKTLYRYRTLPVVSYDSSYRTIKQHAEGFDQWAATLENRIERYSQQIDSLRSVERRLLKSAPN